MPARQTTKHLHPTIAFGFALLLSIWSVAGLKIRSDADEATADVLSDLTNYSLLFQQDVMRTATNLDRIIKFIRRSYEQSGYNGDWASLVQEDYTFNASAAQIAVINENGMMITSSAMLHPKVAVDLSDREHFTTHRAHPEDFLFVGKPIIGRASGKTSVQFTRRFTKQDGSFGGVIVISLDPIALVATYENLQVPQGTGFALFAGDDIIRASSGAFVGSIGDPVPRGTLVNAVDVKDKQVSIVRERFGDQVRLVATRPVEGTSLSVIVSLADPTPAGSTYLHRYFLYAAAASTLIGLAMIRTAALQRRHLRQVFDLAHNDALTKLPNRLAFQKAIKDYVAAHDRQPFLLHLIDLDRFKAINDTFGHPVGDQLLSAVAARLKAAVRPTDIVYRLGGDEFALLQTDGTSGDGGQVVARRICRLIAEPFEVAGHRLLIGASVGIAAIKPEVPDATALLKAADIALYLAKSEGRGTYREYSAELNDAISQRLSLENDLRMAIEREQLELHYQPKVRLNDGCRTTGYEALVRWRHPERGLVPPNDFIPLAEETGLIVQLGEWVLMRACRDLVAKSPNHTVAVNVSAVQFKRGVVTEVVQRALVLSGLEPSRLEIEITESMLMNDDALVQEQLDALRALGVHIALDDFGTGYSSLSYLERYPIDSVKIDRSFVAKLGTAPRAAAIIKAIIALVGELGMVPVAEGVEHKEQADLLETLGCELAQGYLFGKPQPAASIWPEGERHAA